MKMKVWKIITDLTEEEHDNLVNVFSLEDAEAIREMDEESEIFSWDEIIDGQMQPYLMCSEEIIEKISELCQKYDIKFGPIEITEPFLMGEYEIPDSDFIRYREENLTEDLVYEKIKKLGVDSLTDLDKFVLQNS